MGDVCAECVSGDVWTDSVTFDVGIGDVWMALVWCVGDVWVERVCMLHD